MREGAIGSAWYRDGWLFEPMAEGRVRISHITGPAMIIDKRSWVMLRDAIDKPREVWSNRGIYAVKGR